MFTHRVLVGKSTLVKRILQEFNESSHVTTIVATSYEAKFGLSQRMDKFMCFLPDCKPNDRQGLSVEEFNILIEGDGTDAAVKNSGMMANAKARFGIISIANKSLVPHIFRDDKSGSIIYRICEYKTKRPPTIDDSKVTDVIQNVSPCHSTLHICFTFSSKSHVYALGTPGCLRGNDASACSSRKVLRTR